MRSIGNFLQRTDTWSRSTGRCRQFCPSRCTRSTSRWGGCTDVDERPNPADHPFVLHRKRLHEIAMRVAFWLAPICKAGLTSEPVLPENQPAGAPHFVPDLRALPPVQNKMV